VTLCQLIDDWQVQAHMRFSLTCAVGEVTV
jgi:hypothetical protein